jgi:hypothetical protein
MDEKSKDSIKAVLFLVFTIIVYKVFLPFGWVVATVVEFLLIGLVWAFSDKIVDKFTKNR